MSAGPHKVAAAFIEKIAALPDDLLIPVENTLVDVSIAQGITVLPHMRDFTVIGPSTVTGVSDTPSRRRIFTLPSDHVGRRGAVRRGDPQAPGDRRRSARR